MEASRLKTASKPKKEMPKISDAPAEGVHSDFGHVPEYLQVSLSGESEKLRLVDGGVSVSAVRGSIRHQLRDLQRRCIAPHSPIRKNGRPRTATNAAAGTLPTAKPLSHTPRHVIEHAFHSPPSDSLCAMVVIIRGVGCPARRA